MSDTSRSGVSTRRQFFPFILTASIVLSDQFTKWLVVRFIEPFRLTRDSVSVIGDFVSFIRTQNLGVAFSIGQSWPPIVRRILFIIIPLAVVVVASYYLIKSRDFSNLQRWALAGIIGGGLGNLIDRIFRVDGVVDFILINMYGFLGQRYFPVFNVADSSVTICGILLVVSMIFARPVHPDLAGSDGLAGTSANSSASEPPPDNEDQ
jgi:signal peptidase II